MLPAQLRLEFAAPATGYLHQYGCFRPNCDVALPSQHPYADGGDALAAVLEP